MTKTETIQSEGPPSEWIALSPTNWKWLDDLCQLVQGRSGRQNFINILTDTKTNNSGIRTFFVNNTLGDAVFTDSSGAVDPYLGPDGELIVPTTIIATKRQIINVGACRAYQGNPQTFVDGVASVMVYTATTFDDDSAMVIGTGTFTPIQSGKYSVTATVGFDSTVITADKAVSISIYKSGVIVAANQVHASNVDFPLLVSVTDLMEMDGDTDYLQVFVQQEFGANADSLGVAYACYFTAFKVN